MRESSHKTYFRDMLLCGFWKSTVDNSCVKGYVRRTFATSCSATSLFCDKFERRQDGLRKVCSSSWLQQVVVIRSQQCLRNQIASIDINLPVNIKRKRSLYSWGFVSFWCNISYSSRIFAIYERCTQMTSASKISDFYMQVVWE